MACRSTFDPPPPPAIVDVAPDQIPAVLTRAHGKAVLLNVWATWCTPCKEEFPELLALGERWSSKGLRVVFISTDPESEAAATREFLAAQKTPGPWYRKVGGDGSFIEAMDPAWSGALPLTQLYDADGRRRAQWEGRIDPAVVEAAVRGLLP